MGRTQWAPIRLIPEKIGCSPETLRRWVRRDEVDSGRRGGVPTAERERLKELERENRELRRANEILRKASAYVSVSMIPTGSQFLGLIVIVHLPTVQRGPDADNGASRFDLGRMLDVLHLRGDGYVIK